MYISFYMKALLIAVIFGCSLAVTQAQSIDIRVEKQPSGGMLLSIDGTPTMINGMNWDYYPIGTNYEYNIWSQDDSTIKKALETEMPLLRDMGANAVRVYTGIPARWIQYIYEEYGIYTMLNHSFGRYGLLIDDDWIADTDYSSKATRDLLLAEVTALAQSYKDTPGLLFYLLGNENNYGLYWEGAETEDFPDEEAKQQAYGETRARPMYRLMNDAALAMKEVNGAIPIAICNGDVLFIDIIAQECTDIDIYGVNAYRGPSFTDLFDVVNEKLDIPLLFTEFGADAYNTLELQEDQEAQASYLIQNWKEIYAHSSGIDEKGICIGGFTFQMSDGWWKYGQTTGLDLHNNMATWSNGGYSKDYVEGKNNMNEEWFGICSKVHTDDSRLYRVIPRAAYFTLQEVHQFNPYTAEKGPSSLQRHFKDIDVHLAKDKAKKILDSILKKSCHPSN